MDLKKQDELPNGARDKKLLGIILAVFALVISIVNFLSLVVFYWQWVWDPMDTILHFASGMWLALVFFYYLEQPKKILNRVIYSLGFVALVGILWEFFELGAEYFMGYDPFFPDLAQDTFTDLAADLSGGFIAILLLLGYEIYSKRRQKIRG